MSTFYLRYLRAELFRRIGKTLTISSGLAIASAIIIVIVSFSQSLSAAQDKVLNPLQNVGTDIMVSRSVSADKMSELDSTTREEYQSDNRISMDFSKLGNPGDAFTNDSFTTGSMLTFDSSETSKLDSSLVSDYASGLILTVTHQEGTIPKVTASFTTGGDTLNYKVEVPQMTDAQRDAMMQAQQTAMAALQAKGIDPNSEEGRQAMREAMRSATGGTQEVTGSVTTEKKTYTQDVGPIETDVKTTTYTIAGVDTSKTNIGLILPSQITSGTYFTGAENEVVINQSYAEKQSLSVGSKISISKVEYTVVGIVDPKLYTNTADVYMPLATLQTISGKTSRINILLVKSSNSYSVTDTTTKLAAQFTGAQVTNSADTASKVSGSLVSASNLTNRFIGITSIIVLAAAFIIVSLLTVLSINKRIREIGTLKALGWSNARIVRQIMMESTVIGVIGAAVGIGLGIGAIALLNHYNISFSADIANTRSSVSGFMGRMMGESSSSSKSSTTTATINLAVAWKWLTLLLGAGTAIIGSLLAGTLAALRASRMKPQEAIRNIE